MAKKTKNTALKGLAAYNLVQKQVKQTIEAQEVTLKKGKYFQGPEKYTYRDLVKQAFEKTKGKSKAEIETLAVAITNRNLAAAGLIEKEVPLPDAGTGYDFHNIPYWMLSDFLAEADRIPSDQEIVVDNSTFSELDSYDGTKSEVITQVNGSIKFLNDFSKATGLTSDNIPSYSGYMQGNKLMIVLVEGSGIASDYEFDQAEQVAKLDEQGLGKTGGKVPEPVRKDDEKYKTLQVVLENEKVRREKVITAREEIETLEIVKKGLESDMRFAREMGDDEEFEQAKADRKEIIARIKELSKLK